MKGLTPFIGNISRTISGGGEMLVGPVGPRGYSDFMAAHLAEEADETGQKIKLKSTACRTSSALTTINISGGGSRGFRYGIFLIVKQGNCSIEWALIEIAPICSPHESILFVTSIPVRLAAVLNVSGTLDFTHPA